MVKLVDLPKSPAEKTGWLWQGDNTLVLPRADAGVRLPRISVVTPSFNQAAFLEETIRSVLLQDYPNLEYIIIDGGSPDASVDIIRRYAPWLAAWVSEPDQGQSDAINKGWQRCTGDLVAWLNSDDLYEPGALWSVAQAYRMDPTVGLLYGNIRVLDSTGKQSGALGYRFPSSQLIAKLEIPYQPAAFFARALLQKIGFLKTSLHYVMDVEILLRALANAPAHYLPTAIATFRLHPNSKTTLAESQFADELLTLLEYVLRQRDEYPALAQMRNSLVRQNFYRLAAKHFYQGGQFKRSLKYIVQACRAEPGALLSILGDEGMGWFVRRLLPIESYRRLAHRIRALR